jgi:hypothetical protein
MVVAYSGEEECDISYGSIRRRSHVQAFRSKLGSYILIPDIDTAFYTCFITREEIQCTRALDEVQSFDEDV